MAGKTVRSSLKILTRHRLPLIFTVLAVLLLLFILVPLAKMVFFSDKGDLWQAVTDITTVKSILLTIYAALIATVIGFLSGVPLAYLLARYDFPLRGVIESLIDLPIVVPHSAAGIALLFVFGRNYLVGKWFNAAGVQFVDSTAGIVIAMLFVSVPFLVNAAKESFRKVDRRLEQAARVLGASPWQTFMKITMPLAWRSILAGNLMMWARGMSEFGAVVILTYHPMIAPVLVYERFLTYGLNQAVPVAAILVIICAFIFIGVRALMRGRNADD